MPVIRTVFSMIARPADEGGYRAEVVELPGCVSQGETKEELLHNIIEAIQTCLEEEYEEDITPQVEIWGVPVPGYEPHQKKVSV